uniref:Uncharacterized protein n=1 Tax=Anopheles farauti TaxID=69004 RepID=A0A182R097_9DIPT
MSSRSRRAAPASCDPSPGTPPPGSSVVTDRPPISRLLSQLPPSISVEALLLPSSSPLRSGLLTSPLLLMMMICFGLAYVGTIRTKSFGNHPHSDFRSASLDTIASDFRRPHHHGPASRFSTSTSAPFSSPSSRGPPGRKENRTSAKTGSTSSSSSTGSSSSSSVGIVVEVRVCCLRLRRLPSTSQSPPGATIQSSPDGWLNDLPLSREMRQFVLEDGRADAAAAVGGGGGGHFGRVRPPHRSTGGVWGWRWCIRCPFRVVFERMVQLVQQHMLIRIVVELDLDAGVAAVAFVPPVGLGLAPFLARSPDQWTEPVMVLPHDNDQHNRCIHLRLVSGGCVLFVRLRSRPPVKGRSDRTVPEVGSVRTEHTVAEAQLFLLVRMGTTAMGGHSASASSQPAYARGYDNRAHRQVEGPAVFGIRDEKLSEAVKFVSDRRSIDWKH